MKIADYIGAPCFCSECTVAGIAGRETRRDPWDGKWMHGKTLARWYAAYDEFRAKAREAVGAKGRHAKGFEPLGKPQ